MRCPEHKDETMVGITHKVTKKWFGGFNNDKTVKWVSKRNALRMSQNDADMQIYLLNRNLEGDLVSRISSTGI